VFVGLGNRQPSGLPPRGEINTGICTTRIPPPQVFARFAHRARFPQLTSFPVGLPSLGWKPLGFYHLRSDHRGQGKPLSCTREIRNKISRGLSEVMAPSCSQPGFKPCGFNTRPLPQHGVEPPCTWACCRFPLLCFVRPRFLNPLLTLCWAQTPQRLHHDRNAHRVFGHTWGHTTSAACTSLGKP
jgi:hypothetical protein